MTVSRETSKANFVLGGLLSCAALLLAASLAAAAWLGPALPLLSPFSGLVSAFSWAACFLPLWLAGAAWVAFLPGLRPRALALLFGSMLPFIPLAIAARISTEGMAFVSAWPLLEAAGMPAILLAIGAIVLLLCALVLRFALAMGLDGGATTQEDDERGRSSGPRALLPAPQAGTASPHAEAPDSPAEGAAIATAPARNASAPSAIPRPADQFVFEVPELPPLPHLRSLDVGTGDVPKPAQIPGDPAAAMDDASQDGGQRPFVPSAHMWRGAAEGDEAPEPQDGGHRYPGAVPEAERGSAAEAGPGKDASHATLAIDGAPPIEFTSVPPRPATPGSEEERKEAALKRILARRKDKPYSVPAEGILTSYPDGQYWIIDDKTKRSAEVLRDTLAEFNIEAEVTGIRKGPVITMFEILPAPGVKLSKITNLSDNIALRLAASSVRIVAPIPGKHAVGIEVPNERRSIVSLREIVENEAFKTAKMEIPVILGKDIAGEAQFIDLVQTPHLLIAGATGSGKSVCVNSIILSILFRRSPREVKLLLIDPKIVELKLYNDIPHLLTPVITEPKRAFQALQYCICEMERRYSMLDRVGVRDIKSYNRKVKEKGLVLERMPYLVVIIDEFADLMATTGKELESTLARLAAMSRAVGIHLVLATQRPSIDVITGLIKANIPSRIAFMVAGKFDSRIIIDVVGAEKLLGRGDMLVATAWDPFPIRMQGAFVSDEEVEKAVAHVKTLGEPEYIDDEIFIDEEEDDEPSLFGDEDDDPLFEKALEIVLQQGKASASYIQRRLKVGYNRASRLVELMEEKGIVGPAKGSKPRDIVRNPEVLGRADPSHRPAAGSEGYAKQGRLIPDAETVPGQRVTGSDEAG